MQCTLDHSDHAPFLKVSNNTHYSTFIAAQFPKLQSH